MDLAGSTGSAGSAGSAVSAKSAGSAGFAGSAGSGRSAGSADRPDQPDQRVRILIPTQGKLTIPLQIYPTASRDTTLSAPPMGSPNALLASIPSPTTRTAQQREHDLRRELALLMAVESASPPTPNA